jgi:hypothetical protein
MRTGSVRGRPFGLWESPGKRGGEVIFWGRGGSGGRLSVLVGGVFFVYFN